MLFGELCVRLTLSQDYQRSLEDFVTGESEPLVKEAIQEIEVCSIHNVYTHIT